MQKVRFIAFFIVVSLYGNLALAKTVTQNSTGGGSDDVSSFNYQAKTVVADPGVGGSQSTNYIYDHGTIWFDDGLTDTVSSPESVPVTNVGGRSSGSGWIKSLFDIEPQIGGVSPVVEVSFEDTSTANAFMANIPQTSNMSAVRMVDAPQAVLNAIENPQPLPQIIRLVDDAGITREIYIVLFKRIVPWLLWIAFACIALGALTLLAFTLIRGAGEYVLWVGGVLIIIGVIGSVVIRFAYRSAPIDPRVVASINVVSEAEATPAVMKLMDTMPIGVHVIKVADARGKVPLTIKVFITPALPI